MSFDIREIEQRRAEAQERWGKTDAWGEFERKSAGRSVDEEQALGGELMEYFARLGTLRGQEPGSEAVQQTIAALQQFITDHYYTCTKPILRGLGQMYVAGGSMTDNIDAAGGPGTAALVQQAIEIYCSK